MYVLFLLGLFWFCFKNNSSPLVVICQSSIQRCVLFEVYKELIFKAAVEVS